MIPGRLRLGSRLVRCGDDAALLLVRSKGGYGGYSDRLIDLRVDDHLEPVAELSRILELWKQNYSEISSF